MMSRLYCMPEKLSVLMAVILIITEGLLNGSAIAADYTCGIGDNPQNPGNIPPLQLHDVNFDQKMAEALSPGQVLYTSNKYTVNYSCYSNFSGQVQPYMGRLDDFRLGILPGLTDAGLGLRILVDGYGAWDIANQEFFRVGPSYSYNSGPLTVSFRLQLYVKEKITKPLKIYFRPADTVRINSQQGSKDNPGVSLITSGWTLQYIPKCLLKVTVPPIVNLGRVITGGKNFSGTLPARKNFTVRAEYNSPSCGTSDDLSQFSVNLNIRFSPPSGTLLRDGNTSLLISGTDGLQNGLKLQIQDWTLSRNIIYNQDSSFYGIGGGGSNFYSRTFTASLSPVQNNPATVRTGKFSVPVMVNISYN
ncbi:hypothetical protein C4O09_003962 [Salmonella enterica subsp. enterica serovar Minnesota]|nr:hypothetical protein [Salmonella enterica subsp. enterica serovar Minnesota]